MAIRDEMFLDVSPANGVGLGPEAAVEGQRGQDLGHALLAVVAESLVVIHDAELLLLLLLVTHLAWHLHCVLGNLGHAAWSANNKTRMPDYFCFLSFGDLIHKGSHREVYRDFRPSLTSSAGVAKG